MASSRELVDRARRCVALLLILAAAAWIARSLTARMDDPSPWLDDQALLTRLATFAAAIERLVPPGEPLGYVQPLDVNGEPILRDNALAYLQAVLAPRRIEPEGHSQFLLVRQENPARPRSLRGLGRARLLAELGEGFQLVRNPRR